MPIGPARMPLMDHLGELRMRLVRIAVCLVVALCVFYLATPTIADFLLLPLTGLLDNDLIFTSAFEGFTVRFMLAFWASLVACSPIILWQIIAFFLPALKPKERKWFLPTVASAVFLFIFGTVFCYLVILNPAFEWLISQATAMGEVLPKASEYMNTIIMFEIAFGFAFELPLVIFYLVLFDVVPYKKLRSNWRTVYVVLMVVSAVVTPDASPVTMLLMFAAMLALYEVSLLIARVALKRRIKRREEQEAAEAAELAS